MKALELTGSKFGRLLVLSRAKNKGIGTSAKAQWLCSCDCGQQTTVAGYSLRSGNTKSCGCLKVEASIVSGSRLNYRHGKTGSRAHSIWSSMLQRCHDPKHKSFPSYGGRGISVCDSWMDFENFHADMGDPPDGHSLDRKMNNEGYSKSNCRWATPTEQANNRRDNFKLTAFGQSLTLRAWSRATGLSKATIMYRVATGMSASDALSTPPRKNGAKTNRFQAPVSA